MSLIGSDVSPTTASLMVTYWRTTPFWQKLAHVNELNQSLQTLATSDLRRRYPTESDMQIRRRLATRWLGAELAERVYGPIDEEVDATN